MTVAYTAHSHIGKQMWAGEICCVGEQIVLLGADSADALLTYTDALVWRPVNYNLAEIKY